MCGVVQRTSTPNKAVPTAAVLPQSNPSTINVLRQYNGGGRGRTTWGRRCAWRVLRRCMSYFRTNRCNDRASRLCHPRVSLMIWHEALGHSCKVVASTQSFKYQYKYQYLSLKYQYRYKYSKMVLKCRSSTSTSTQYYNPAFLYTQGEVMSQSLWSRYDRHFLDIGLTRYNALSKMAKIYHVIQINWTSLLKMSTWSLTYQQSVFKRYHSDNHFSEFLPTRWRRKSTVIDMEQNYVTVSLRIHLWLICYFDDCSTITSAVVSYLPSVDYFLINFYLAHCC